MRTLGTAACPPYHLAFVIGGTSAEACLKTVKLASARALDGLPTTGSRQGQAFRDLELEAALLEAAQQDRDRRAVRRQVLRARRARRPAAAARRLVPDRHGRLLLGGPQHPRQDRPRGGLGRGARAQPRPLHPRALPQRAPRARRSRSTSTGRCRRSWPSCRSTPWRTRRLAHRHDRRGARHRAREAQGTARPRRGAAAVLQGPPGLLRGAGEDAGRACRRARSARRPPAAWTRTSTSSSRTAARW